MVHPLVISLGSKIIRSGISGLKTFSRYEGKTYTKLYGRTPGRGVRHGLALGSAAGSLIKPDNGIEPDGSISQNNGIKASKSNQARSGYKRNSGSSRRVHIQYCNSNRRSNSSKYYRR